MDPSSAVLVAISHIFRRIRLVVVVATPLAVGAFFLVRRGVIY
jgi:hypothetical protein